MQFSSQHHSCAFCSWLLLIRWKHSAGLMCLSCVVFCEQSTATVKTTPTTTYPSTGHLSASHPSRPSPSNSDSDSSATVMPQAVAMHPSLDASALTRVQSANQSQQQQWAAILQQLHAMMMMQGLMPWGVPIHGPSYQAALQDPLGQQLEPLGQMAQQPSTAQVAVMQQTPPHLTTLLDSSVVRETSWPIPTRPAVVGDGGAVDPPTQGAVQGGLLLRLE